MEHSFILSIITVNFNSGLNLKKTLSALKEYAQHDDVELILIDGKSTDCSVRDADEYKNSLTKFISEEDYGIFDAMNKGIKHSRGKWIWFINSGDIPIITVSEIVDLINRADQEESNFIFSDLMVNGALIKQQLNIKTLLFSMINHQNIIYNRTLLIDGYDHSFMYCADYYHLLDNFKSIVPCKSTVPLCCYDMKGVSSILSRKRRVNLWGERLKAQQKSKIGFLLKLLLMIFSLMVIVIKLINPRIGSRNISETNASN